MINESIQFIPKEKKKRLLIYLISIVIVNITLAIIEPTGNSIDLRGQTVSPVAVKQAVIMTLLVGNTFIGFVLGLVLSLIPYKNLPYQKKYLTASIIAVLILQIIYLIMELKYLISFYV